MRYKLIDSTEEFLCEGTSIPHIWESIDVARPDYLFKVLRCIRCGAIDPCGIPSDFFEDEIITII